MVEFVSLGVGLAVAFGVLLKSFTGHHHFAPGVCERLLPYLQQHIVGQDLALTQLADAVCDHLDAAEPPPRPLVISAHGPPGVGKSLTHFLMARAMYSAAPGRAADCPGQGCPGYKVLYGMDYVSAERDGQHAALRSALVEHLARSPESLLVVEEYDKLDCPTRGLFRQLLENPAVANLTLGRSIVLLESNTGYSQLHQLLLESGGRSQVSAEDATRALKDTVFVRWAASGCEERADTSKLVGLVSFFLPYFPLERQHVQELFGKRLAARREALAADRGMGLTWDCPGLPAFLASKVDFDGAYPIEGAKEVGTLMTRYVSSALRRWEGAHRESLPGLHRRGGASLHLSPPARGSTELRAELLVAESAGGGE